MTVRPSYFVALLTIVLATIMLQAATHDQPILVRRPLKELPLQLGGWEGRTEFFEPGILAALKPDDYLLRRYRSLTGGALWLYIAYYGSQRFGDRVHSPAVCLPGAGWYIADAGVTPVRLSDRTVTVNRNVVQKGDQTQLVLYWYQMHGTVVAKELQAMTVLAWTALTARRSDEALVRINAPVVGTLKATLERQLAFVQAAFPQLERSLPR